MAKVIVPKNQVYTNTYSAGVTLSNILTTDVILNNGILSDDYTKLGYNITINYGLSNNTLSINNLSSIVRYCTIKNNANFNSNFIILTVSGFPKVLNIGTSLLPLRLRLQKSDGTNINLYSINVIAGNTFDNIVGESFNQTYYIDLVNNTATKLTDTSFCNKAIIPSDEFWQSVKNVYNCSSVSENPNITLNNPHPMIINNNYIDWPFDDSIRTSNIVITVTCEESTRYLKLEVVNTPRSSNTAQYTLNLKIIGTINKTIVLKSITPSDLYATLDGIYYIDLVNGVVISGIKAITHI